MKRALSVDDIENKKYKLFDFTGEWFDAFGCPARNGVWFIWGNSGNGKTSFVLQLVKHLAQFGRVLINSLEEGSEHTMQKGYKSVGMAQVRKRVLLVEESCEELAERLRKKHSPDIVIIDSFQYTQLSYKQYIEFKRQFKNKLLIFISHADGKQPSGRSARSVMYDATLKIWVEGYRAFSKGRYIGETGEYVIWDEKAAEYWGE